ncbi:MAG: Regulator of RpoS [Verrucomicrobiae bacterium]|nr:Regulator of RpoS [Verrucomicrobiae bacterium]
MEKKRILMIDDEVPFTNLVKMNLERTGRYEVRVENHPLQAVAAALEFKPAAILLDVVMPQMDGGQLLAEFQTKGQLKNTPVILLTATVTQQVAKALQGQVGCRTIVPKPVDAKRLIQLLDEMLEMPFFSFRFGRSASADEVPPPA